MYQRGCYERSPRQDPQGPDAEEYRVMRGGAFNLDDYVRCAVRGPSSPDYCDNALWAVAPEEEKRGGNLKGTNSTL